jgi:adenosine kinase
MFREQIMIEQLESLSLSFLVDRLVRHRGGVATNIAYTLSLLGERPTVLATVGDDFGEYRAWLEARGVDTSGIRVMPGLYTASFFATTDRCNAQIASFYPGAMARAGELSLRELLHRPDLILVSPNDPMAMERVTREAVELGIPYFYDPSQQVARFEGPELTGGIRTCRGLVCNEYEFGLICKKTGWTPSQIAATVSVLVVTLGEKGSRIQAEGREYLIPAVTPERIADPTGVGDAYRAGLLKGYLRGMDWETSGRIGALAAAYCLEREGTQSHSFTPDEFSARFERVFGEGRLVREALELPGGPPRPAP